MIMSRSTASRTCPLCLATVASLELRGADDRLHFLCSECGLISADRRELPSRAAERDHYRTHENSIHNAGYVQFLNQIVEPLLPHLKPGMRCLDFGCGPGPTLCELVRRQGIDCDDYDPIFRDVPVSSPYDAVFATECLEHFHSPARDIRRITELLRPGGFLGIMTELWTDLDAFATWYYTRDPTHVAFYHSRSLEFIRREYGLSGVYSDGRRVHVLRRNPYAEEQDCLTFDSES